MLDRRLLTHAVSFGAGVLLASLVWWQYQDYLELTRRSSVDQPLAVMLEDMTASASQSESQLVLRTTELLRAHWLGYLEGGPSPEQFMNAVVAARVAE